MIGWQWWQWATLIVTALVLGAMPVLVAVWSVRNDAKKELE
jgi:hypothetical protein